MLNVDQSVNVDQLFSILKLDRTEHMICERFRSLVALGKSPIEGENILEPPIVNKPVYLYLKSKHTHLIPAIVKALRACKADCTHKRLQKQALLPYLSPKYYCPVYENHL